jgi:hypothetical protein
LDELEEWRRGEDATIEREWHQKRAALEKSEVLVANLQNGPPEGQKERITNGRGRRQIGQENGAGRNGTEENANVKNEGNKMATIAEGGEETRATPPTETTTMPTESERNQHQQQENGNGQKVPVNGAEAGTKKDDARTEEAARKMSQ